MRVSHHPEGKISECAVMREVGMGLDQSSPKSALVINNVALLVALVGGYHQLSWIISGNSIPNTAAEQADCLGWLKTNNTVKGGQYFWVPGTYQTQEPHCTSSQSTPDSYPSPTTEICR